jgi:hypothetical protein
MSGLRTYRFCTEILAVNRAIHDEAEELMYKRNIFVVISYQSSSPLTQAFGGLVWVPMVSKKLVNRMRLHSLRIHLAIDDAGLPASSIQSCIILADGLEAFSFVARVGTSQVADPGPAVTVMFASGTPIVGLNEGARSGRKVGSTKLLCDFRETKYRSMDDTLQHRLLTPLASIMSPSQRTVFKGTICNLREIEHIKQVMSPTVFSAEATFLWELKSCMLAKDIADSARHHNSLGFVLSLLVLAYSRLNALVSDTGMVKRAAKDFPKGVEWMEMLRLEMLINIAWAHLKLNDMKGFNIWARETHATMERLCERLDHDRIPAGIKAYYINFMMWAFLYGETSSKITVGSVLFRLRAIEKHPHQYHDLKIIERHNPNPKAILTEEILPFDQCSITQLPWPATSFYKTIEGLEQSMRLKGWHNVESIRSLDKDTKKAINALQKKHGLLVTDFDSEYIDFNQGDEVEKS